MSAVDEAGSLDAEDAKLITLARGARGRIGAQSAAAVRDETGRTYASASVTLPSLALSGVALAVGQAAASGARGLESVVVIGADPSPDDLAVIRDLGGHGVPVLACHADGSVRTRLTS